MITLKKVLLVFGFLVILAGLAGVGYFARERYSTTAALEVGGKTADEAMALLVKALGEKDIKTAQGLFSHGNEEGYVNWQNILKTNESKNLLEVMSKSLAIATQYGEATEQLKRFIILNKLKTEGLIFSVAPNVKTNLWQISDLSRATFTQKK